MSRRQYVPLPCGCVHDGDRYHNVCPDHTVDHIKALTAHTTAMRARDPEYVSLRDTLADIAMTAGGAAQD